MASAIADNEVNILGMGSAHMGCWIVVNEEHKETAANAVAEAFNLIEK